MKKIYVIVQKKDVDFSLSSLRDLGCVHIEHQSVPKSPSLDNLKDEYRILSKGYNILQSQKAAGTEVPEPEDLPRDNWRAKAQEIITIRSKTEQIAENIQERQFFIEQWGPWGNFEPQDIKDLRDRGLYIQLYEIREKNHVIPKGIFCQIISEDGGIKRCVAVADKEFNLPFKKIELPTVSLSALKELKQKDLEKMAALNQELDTMRSYGPALGKALGQIKEMIAFEEVLVGMKQNASLSVLKGYCPEELCSKLEKKCRDPKLNWGLLIQDPDPQDKVPTLLKNPRWVKVISPILDIAGILPGYKEMDISPFLLLFLSLFVGMLVGDAGYGATIAALVGAIHFLNRKKIKESIFFKLVYLFCGCAVVWGVLTGTYFGQQWISGLIPPVAPWLNNGVNLQMLCFLIGAVHLTVAHVWRIILKWPSLTVLSEVGWLALVWGMFFAAKLLVLGLDFPSWAIAFFIIGPIGVYLFSSTGKGWLGQTAGQIFPNTLSIIAAFTDVVSYIRLYAVGLATVAIADAANNMSLVGILVLHFLNILLAALAILVHGLRLNVLEFSSHLGLEWTGFAYKPFIKEKG